ncbi:MAG: polyphosphate kinase 1, partial [Sphingomonadales bacterium]
VLEEARNRKYPLLERLRFLSISGSNLDEIFMVRVAGLRGQQIRKIDELSIDGMTAGEQLEAITHDADALMAEQQKLWQHLRKQLANEGISVIEPGEIGKKAETAVEKHFRDQILPVLTPQALDPAHPFPFIPNKGLSLILEMRRLSDKALIRQLIMIPPALPRFVRVPGPRRRFVTIEELIKFHIGLLFPEHKLLSAGAFRIIRDSDIEIEEEAEDLVRHYRSAIKRRRRGRVIRLKMQKGISAKLQKLVREALGGESSILSETMGFLGIGDLAQLVDEDRKALKFKPYTPRFPERILEQAASDPDVIAIKQTLYRAGKQSAVIRALCDAAEAGKSVTAVVELKARFDEEQNLLWASQLERSGVQVIYGFVDMKTHAKISMVVRKEAGSIRTYCHFGTGNYHPLTAKVYTDLSFFTADPRLGRDAGQIFNFVTGYVEPHGLEMLSMSPLGMREHIAGLIDAEIAFAREGKPASLWAKLNSLVDPKIINKLYEASEAGVEIDLVVRGICCLRPGVPGLSSRIRVKSIIGRFLEHSRIWAFGNGKDMPHPGALVFISSADWMSRNFDRRVEYMLPIENPTVHDQILDQVMVANLIDNQQSWKLLPSGEYERIKAKGRKFNLHHYFMTNPSLSGRGGALAERNDVPKLDLIRQ